MGSGWNQSSRSAGSGSRREAMATASMEGSRGRPRWRERTRTGRRIVAPDGGGADKRALRRLLRFVCFPAPATHCFNREINDLAYASGYNDVVFRTRRTSLRRILVVDDDEEIGDL